MNPTRREAIQCLSSAAAGWMIQLPDCLALGACAVQPDLVGFTSMCFTDTTGAKHQIYVKGSAGPPVILLHEITGLTTPAVSTARQLADAGYTPIVPLLFGELEKSAPFRNMQRVCGDDKFACNRGERTSPEVQWLRQLSQCVRRTWPDAKGVGVIGMCLTGAFPIPMLRTPEVVAPVLCQPTLPFNRMNPLHAFGWFTDQRALAVHPDDLQHAKRATSVPLLGIRYKGDRKCQAKRFERLTKEFPDRFFRLDVPGRHHSTLAGDFCPDAFREVLSFFNQHLRTSPDSCSAPFPILSQANSLAEVTPSACRGGTHAISHSDHTASSKGSTCLSA
ncbi:hypothetical protein BH18ACI5_BH18ACI5_06690 [soil metagenome]